MGLFDPLDLPARYSSMDAPSSKIEQWGVVELRDERRRVLEVDTLGGACGTITLVSKYHPKLLAEPKLKNKKGEKPTENLTVLGATAPSKKRPPTKEDYGKDFGEIQELRKIEDLVRF